jgi:hypothetical protein
MKRNLSDARYRRRTPSRIYISVRLGASLALALASALAHAIVNGTPVSAARAADFAWAVALEYPRTGDVCAGQVVSPTWILTAGHCASLGLHARVGHAERALAADLEVVEAVKHPRYDAKGGAFDVGLVRLAAPVAPQPVRLATRAESQSLLRADARAVIAGWGRRSASLSYSPRLVVSDVELRELSREESRFMYYDPVSGPCGGDSGGPLLLQGRDGRWLLAGIASRVVGSICAQGGGVGIYVDVGAVRDFIEAHVKDLPR